MQEQDRLVAGAAASPNEENVDRALRPTVLRDYFGQEAIREQLHITDNTLQKHMQNIYRKLHISSRLELFRIMSGS